MANGNPKSQRKRKNQDGSGSNMPAQDTEERNLGQSANTSDRTKKRKRRSQSFIRTEQDTENRNPESSPPKKQKVSKPSPEKKSKATQRDGEKETTRSRSKPQSERSKSEQTQSSEEVYLERLSTKIEEIKTEPDESVPFSCSQCPKKFPSKTQLKKHRKAEHASQDKHDKSEDELVDDAFRIREMALGKVEEGIKEEFKKISGSLATKKGLLDLVALLSFDLSKLLSQGLVELCQDLGPMLEEDSENTQQDREPLNKVILNPEARYPFLSVIVERTVNKLLLRRKLQIQCKLCDKKFKTEQKLRKHINESHVFPCPECTKEFAEEIDCLWHRLSEHKINRRSLDLSEEKLEQLQKKEEELSESQKQTSDKSPEKAKPSSIEKSQSQSQLKERITDVVRSLSDKESERNSQEIKKVQTRQSFSQEGLELFKKFGQMNLSLSISQQDIDRERLKRDLKLLEQIKAKAEEEKKKRSEPEPSADLNVSKDIFDEEEDVAQQSPISKDNKKRKLSPESKGESSKASRPSAGLGESSEDIGLIGPTPIPEQYKELQLSSALTGEQSKTIKQSAVPEKASQDTFDSDKSSSSQRKRQTPSLPWQKPMSSPVLTGRRSLMKNPQTKQQRSGGRYEFVCKIEKTCPGAWVTCEDLIDHLKKEHEIDSSEVNNLVDSGKIIMEQVDKEPKLSQTRKERTGEVTRATTQSKRITEKKTSPARGRKAPEIGERPPDITPERLRSIKKIPRSMQKFEFNNRLINQAIANRMIEFFRDDKCYGLSSDKTKCQFLYKDEETFASHYKSTHHKNPYRCELCSAALCFSKVGFQNHMETYHKLRKMTQCNICHQENSMKNDDLKVKCNFYEEDEAVKHFNEKHPYTLYQCSCKEIFQFKSSFVLHERKKHNILKCRFRQCGLNFGKDRNGLAKHLKEAHGKYLCVICLSEFKVDANLKLHINLKHPRL